MRTTSVLPGTLAAADTKALTVESVYREHHTLLLRWTARLAGPRADLDDAFQEVLLNVHRALPGYKGEALITTWLYQLTRRVVGRLRRRERVRRWLFGAAQPDEEHEPQSPAPGPATAVERRQDQLELYRALDGLSEKHRTAFLLFEMEQLPAEEIARIMGTRPGTVWVWLHRARSRLRELLASEGSR